MHAKKITTVMDLAAKNGAPFIGLNDSGGANPRRRRFTRWIRTDFLSKFDLFGRHPTNLGHYGTMSGGAVYSQAITDFVFMVEKTSQMFITGPKVIETVTGEKISFEDLGGAKVHNAISGNAHFKRRNRRRSVETSSKTIKLSSTK